MTKAILLLLIGAGVGFIIAALVEKHNGGGRWGW